MNIEKVFEVRGHARGGQGMVTAFEILAKIFSYTKNYEVQAFPFFGVERTGAPIQAYLRISPKQILNRSNIYTPNLVVVFDEGLIGQTPVFDGLSDDGIILINSDNHPSFYKGKAKNIFTVPATTISLEKKLGSKALPIVNAAMIGAILKILDAGINEAAKEIIRKEVPSKPEANSQAAEMAYKSVIGFLDVSYIKAASTNNKAASTSNKLPAVPYWDKPMSLNKTGNWRVFAPEYVNRRPPCNDNCPAGTDVRKFVDLVTKKKFKEAYEEICKHNPFPSVCGRVCPHFCQQNCNRGSFDEQLNIGAIERFLGDKNSAYRVKSSPVKYKETIAVIGSGPAGLTASLRLRQIGYPVTVFESFGKAGGMMRTGIPEFRLPEKVLDKEIKKITEQGVKIVLDKKVSINELKKDFSAVIAAVGSHIGASMKLPNENEIIEGIKFLREIKFNESVKLIRKGDQVAVIGGGNTAIDVARTVLRLGANPVIYYRRTRQEMPAIAHEVEEALKEGVKIEFLTAPVKVERNGQGKYRLTMIKMKLDAADESGRRIPVPVAGSEKKIIVSKVIKAIGQTYDEFVFGDEKVKTKQGKINGIFGDDFPVFVCGDMAWGGTVVEAIGSGNEVAKEVDAFFRNREYIKPIKHTDVVSSDQINYNYYLPVAANHNPFRRIKNYFNDFTEVVGGLTTSKVIKEASRCLHCGDCFTCGNCINFCPDAAIHVDEENRLRIDYDYCKGCGICIHECPCSAIRFDEQKELVEL